MPAFDFEAVEKRWISGRVVAKDSGEAEDFIVNQGYDYSADDWQVEVTVLREVEPDCS